MTGNGLRIFLDLKPFLSTITRELFVSVFNILNFRIKHILETIRQLTDNFSERLSRRRQAILFSKQYSMNNLSKISIVDGPRFAQIWYHRTSFLVFGDPMVPDLRKSGTIGFLENGNNANKWENLKKKRHGEHMKNKNK